jgi:hypothetical protein
MQDDGKTAKLANTPIAQTLPNTEDGFIYILLGWAINTTNIELQREHPVYEYKNGAIRELKSQDAFTNIKIGNSIIQASTKTDTL